MKHRFNTLSDTQKKIILFIVAGIVIVLALVLYSILTANGNTPEAKNDADTTVIPILDEQELAENKTSAYENNSKTRKSNSMIDDNMATIFDDSDIVSPDAQEEPAGKDKGKDQPSSDPETATLRSQADETLALLESVLNGTKEDTADKNKDVTKTTEQTAVSSAASSSQTSASARGTQGQKEVKTTTPSGTSSGTKTASSTKTTSSAKTSSSTKAPSKTGTAARTQNGAAVPSETQQSNGITTEIESVRRTKGITSLTGSSKSKVVSIGNDGDDINTKPVKVRFAKTEKVVTGARIMVRLLDDIVVNNTTIPSNTMVPAVASINGDRLNLVISTMNVNGTIYTLNYEAYDTDGKKGLYCPESQTNKKAEEAAKAVGEITTQTILQRVTGTIAQNVIGRGTSIINGNSEKAVSVPSGYTFYIAKIKEY